MLDPKRPNARAGPLGILMLENVPMPFVGCMGNPETFRYSVLYRTVPGAWAEGVMAGDPRLTPALQRAAQQLVDDGAVALTTNCGFFVRYQQAIAAAVSVPVATSSLTLLPFLTHIGGAHGRIGIITADARLLEPPLLRHLGLLGMTPIAIGGVQGSHSWHQMQQPVPAVDPEQLRRDALESVDRLRREFSDLRCLLLECTGLGPCAREIRRSTGLPVYDSVTTADLLMAGVLHS